MQLQLSLVEGRDIFPTEAADFVFDELGGVIGRSPECDWVLECPRKLISRRHAIITFEDGQFSLYDASANGVFHNASDEPIGNGWRQPLADGDSLRMGDFVFAVSITTDEVERGVASDADMVSTAADAPEASVPETDAHTQRTVAGPATVAPLDPEPMSTPRSNGARHPDLGAHRDAFQPLPVVIPEDWDESALNGTDEQLATPMVSVAERLNAFDTDPMRKFWEALRLEEYAEQGKRLTPELAQALGECLRVSMQGLFRIKQDAALAEQKLLGRSIEARSESHGLDDFASAQAYLRVLANETQPHKRRRLLMALAESVGQLRRRQSVVANSLDEAFSVLVNEFAPERAEQRYQEFLRDSGGTSWTERLRRRLSPGGIYWRFYRFWYAGERRSAFAVLNRLFEKRFAAAYQSRQKSSRDGE